MPAPMANGGLSSSPTRSRYPSPAAVTDEKSIWCTSSPAAASSPNGRLFPVATTRPARSSSCQSSGAVLSAGSAAILADDGR